MLPPQHRDPIGTGPPQGSAWPDPAQGSAELLNLGVPSFVRGEEHEAEFVLLGKCFKMLIRKV